MPLAFDKFFHKMNGSSSKNLTQHDSGKILSTLIQGGMDPTNENAKSQYGVTVSKGLQKIREKLVDTNLMAFDLMFCFAKGNNVPLHGNKVFNKVNDNIISAIKNKLYQENDTINLYDDQREAVDSIYDKIIDFENNIDVNSLLEAIDNALDLLGEGDF
ncbi:MAG: hypothetical protein HRU35_04540 [Rickettsiaceae bacterium]|nr:hypothetical protein [Rickettsiaceae bacterium]